PVLFGTQLRTRYQFTVRCANHQPTGDVEQLLARLALQVRPELVGTSQEWHVIRVLVVRHADDARLAVGGTLAMAGREGVQTEYALAAAAEVPQRSAAHRADADNDRVELCHALCHSEEEGRGISLRTIPHV